MSSGIFSHVVDEIIWQLKYTRIRHEVAATKEKQCHLEAIFNDFLSEQLHSLSEII